MNDHTVILAAPATSSDTGQQPLTVGTLIDGFEIRGVIGLGGFGIVYEAWDPMLERQIAMKEYLPGSLAIRLPGGPVQVRDMRNQCTFDSGMRSFINEARLLAQFDHPALVKVYRFWEMSGTAYMAMPLYRGATLKQHLEQHREHQRETLAESTLVRWLVSLTEALEVMHSQQCYHRDVSPENIIIQAHTGLPVLLDFGAARRAIEHASQPFTVILKASYAPIEQYAEVPSLTQGPWTDVYALAGVAYYLMTGKTPPPSVSRMVNDNYIPLVSLDKLPFSMALKHAVDKALAVHPSDRTQSMQQFRDAMLNQQADVQDLFNTSTQVKILQPGNPVNASTGQGHEYGNKYDHQKDSSLNWLWSVGAGLFSVVGLIFGVWVISGQEMNQPVDGPSDSSPHAVPQASIRIDSAFQAVLDGADSKLEIQPGKTVLKIEEDLLQFKVRSPVSGYVAVYIRSSDNTLIQLLPNARVPAVRIGAGQLLTLPPANEPIQAAGPAGTNQFLIVVTEQHRDYAHLRLQDHYGFGLIAKAPHGLQGTSPCASPNCRDRMAAGWFSVEEVD